MAIIRKGLPTSIAASLGRIIARWAFQEHLLNIVTYNALGVSIKQGRIAVRQNVSPSHRMALIADLLVLRGLSSDRKYLAQIGERIEDAKLRRDMLAHSAWIREGGQVAIQDTTGQWDLSGTPHERSGGFKIRITRKMQPGFLKIDRAYLATLRDDIEKNIKITIKLNQDILLMLEALRKRQREQPQTGAPPDQTGQMPNTPPPQPATSGG